MEAMHATDEAYPIMGLCSRARRDKDRALLQAKPLSSI